ncbi:MAG TPA: inositol monophosphatase [Phycisphaerae bacterium]|nr:inositol monophosphatase [Phycisphaerae bacterium]
MPDGGIIDLRRATCDLVQIGAAEALRWFGKVTALRKADHTPVTAADHASQEAILYHVGQRYPKDAVLVEEEIARPSRHSSLAGADRVWVVDPIDGTRNFARGVNVFAVSVAVLQANRPVAGAVYDATSGLVYSASTEDGAFCNDQPMRLESSEVESDATIALSSFRKRQTPKAVTAWMQRFLFRNHGSVALHLAWVAAGLLEAAYSVECKLWDIAAGALLVEAAGGVVTDGEGRPRWPVDVVNYAGEDLTTLAAMPAMHAQLMSNQA